MAKNHLWRIKRIYFDQLMSGEKQLEIRVGYSWVKSVHQGDTITFENYGKNCFLVERVMRYSDFFTMLKSECVSRVLPGMSFDEALETLRRIYPRSKEALGVYIFELKPQCNEL